MRYMPPPRQGWRRPTAGSSARVLLARLARLRCPASLLVFRSAKKKRGYLESNRALGTAHGGTGIYRLERHFDPDFRAPPRFADPRLALDFRPPELDFRLADFRAPDRLEDLLD